MGRSRDIAGILGKSEAENANNLAFLNTSSPTGVDSAQVQNIGLQAFDTIDSLPINNLEAGQQAYVTGTNRLYVSNGSGWFNVALINASPSLTISPSGAITLATDGTPTTITLTATDSDGPASNITFSVESDGSFYGLGTISQDSSVFTITPKLEDSAITTSSTLTFKASDGINFGSGTSALSLTFSSPVVDSSEQTIILLKATSASANTSIADASTNSATVTNSSRPQASTFSPYRPNGYSFSTAPNNAGWLSYPSGSHFDFGTGDFTIEWWQYWEKTPAGGDTLMSLDYVTSPNFLIETAPSAAQYNFWLNSTSVQIQEGTAAGHSTWNHYAIVRNGSGSNNITIYRNGQVSGQGTYTGSIGKSSANLQLLGGTGGPNQFLETYVSDVRIVKGTAVYTSTFTPPTEPLEAITGTSLLVGNAPHINDTSSNRFTATEGATGIQSAPFSPYAKAVYDQATHGGSVYLKDNAFFRANLSNIGTGQVTVECWCYFDDMGSNHTIFCSDDTSTFDLYWQSASSYFKLYTTSAQSVGGTYVPPVRQWIHVALTRDGNTATLYINGKQVGSATDTSIGSANLNGANFKVGSYTNSGSEIFRGHISDFRIGSGIKYSSDFNPPTSPVGNTGAELYFGTGSDCVIQDLAQAQYGMYLENTSITGSNSQTKNADYSIYFPGTSGAHISLINHQDLLNLQDADWTVEYWFYQIGSLGTVVHWDVSATGLAGSNMTSIYHSNASLYYYAQGQSVLTANNVLSADTWHHIAFVRKGSNGYIFVDGQEEANTGSMIMPNNDYTWRIGDRIANAPSANYPVYGYMEDFRITKGVARYTSNFTPPTSSFEG